MTQKVRIAIYVVFAAVFAAVMASAVSGLPVFGDYKGPYGDLVMDTVLELRHAQQGVAAVTFDYRGFDTLGEEFILFAAVAGALLLMRPQEIEQVQERRDQADDRTIPEQGTGVLGAGVIMFPFTLILGMYIVLHGHLTPGGGFQGGVVLASAFYFVYLSGEYDDLLEFVEGHTVGYFETAGAAAFAIIAAIPLLQHRPFMENNLPFGESGKLLSGGALPLYNCAVGIEVGAAFLLLISAFLRQMLVIRIRKKS